MARFGTLILTLACLAVATRDSFAEQACLLPGRGHFRIHVGAGGLFGAFAHDHDIEAQKIEGCASVDLKNAAQSSVKLTFAAAGLRVLDPKESAEDRAKVQKTMETDVLQIAAHPAITFESTGVEAAGSDSYRVKGNLTIRGKSNSVVIPLKVSHLSDGTYQVTGEYKLKQTAFGIEPISLMGGTVKVKDEIRTEFELLLK